MAFFQVHNVKISGIAAVVPDEIVCNSDYEWISEREREILVNTTGIKERRFAKKGICASDLGEYISNKLIHELKWDCQEIEALVFVSQCRDYILPNTACILQDRLGLSKNCMALDIPLGCSGYVYGMSVISSLMMTGGIKKGILIAGDVSSHHLSYKDKSVYPLFGDAVSVTAFEYSENINDKFSFLLQTDGSGYKSIYVPDGGHRNDFTGNSLVDIQYEDGIVRNKKNLFLDGLKVFEFSIKEVSKNIKQLIQNISSSIDDFDYFILHQANQLMNETIRKQLKVDSIKFPTNLSKFGNTSSASIPLTIVSELRNHVISENNKFILSGFGVGLSWGAVALSIDNIICPELYEYH